jgi:hypothetical protein
VLPATSRYKEKQALDWNRIFSIHEMNHVDGRNENIKPIWNNNLELMEKYTWKKNPKWNKYLHMQTKQTFKRKIC